MTLIQEKDKPGGVYGSCGCRLDDIPARKIQIKNVDEKGNRVVESLIVCDSCAVWYAKHRLIIHNKQEEKKWIEEGK